jgi:large subunit ribosomal protein L29
MQIAELRQLTIKKLWEKLKFVRRELAVLRFRVKTGQSVETSKIKEMKLTIARILTLLNRND